jgi:hypothetical protein
MFRTGIIYLITLNQIMKESNTYDFVVESKGKTHKCTRTVYGKRRLSQIISVIGHESKKDPSRYGDRGYPVKDMATDASEHKDLLYLDKVDA